MLNHQPSVLKVALESFAVLKMHKDLKENSLLPSLFNFHPSIPPLSWLSPSSALHWPFSSRVWKNKERRKGQEQRPAAATQERDVLMCCLLPDPLHWFWTCHADLHTHFFFSRAETQPLSLTPECGGTVPHLCQVDREDTRNPSCQLPHRPHT